MDIKKIKLESKTKRRFNLYVEVEPSFGFTIIELMVTISIFLIVTVATLASFPRFSNKLSVDLLGEDISLSIKQAQVFGSSIFGSFGETTGGVKQKTFNAYGVHLEKPLPVPSTGSIKNYNYLFYSDLAPANASVGDKIYNGLPANDPSSARGDNPALSCGSPTPGQECLEKYVVNGVNKVLWLCANYRTSGNAGNTTEERIASCKSAEVNSVDITFVRASLEASFSVVEHLGDTPISDVENVGIVLGVPSTSTSGAAPSGSYRKVVIIWKTGLISLE